MYNIETLIKNSFEEDIKTGDHSSLACISKDEEGKAKLIVKEKGIIAGVEIAKKVFNFYDKELDINIKINDGEKVNNGDIAFYVEGKIHSLLATERLMLNIMQRMGGIATKTYNYSQLISDLPTKILDTRKTVAGLRELDKIAVKMGGGENHRFGLYDMIMLKDNHIDFAGGIKNAIIKTNEYLKINNLDLKTEIETRDLNEVEQVLSIGNIDRIMLDNFNFKDTKKAVKLINKKFEIESSGGITKDTLREYALCGVDFISIGELTHSVKGLDMSFKAF